MTYNRQYGNEFIIHSPQRPTSKINKADVFYHDMRHLLENKDTHIMVNDYHPPILQVQEKNKIYTARNIKWADGARRLQNITGQLIKQILHALNDNTIQNLPILREDVRIAEYIYGPSIPHLKSKTVRRKIQHVEPIKITSVPLNILDNYKEVTI